MTKHILSLSLSLIACIAMSAQVSFSVNDPSPNAGGYEISVADGTDWGSPDMTDPANVVTGTMCLVQDDSLTCEGFAGITNAADLSGKIAVVYRGACEFGSKALAVQEAGAIACIIVNHSPGVIPMGGGADGGSVTIPVIMISNADGATIYDDFSSCGSDAIIGNLNGFYANNLRLTKGTLLRPESYGRVSYLSQDDTEFSVETGTWVYNFGQSQDDNVVVTTTASLDGSVIWSESSDPVSIPVGDSAYVIMPVFSQATYANGLYELDYTVAGSGDDGFAADNISPAHFRMGNTFSYSRLGDDGRTNPTNYTSPAEFTGEQNFCLFFTDPNASRVAVDGMDFSGTHFTETILDMDIEIAVYEWGDDYAGLATTFTDFDELDSEGYTFEEGDDDQVISLDFGAPIELEDDVNYAFCLRHSNEDLQLGFDNKTDYTLNVDSTDMPIFPYWDEGESFPLLFGADLAPAISVRMSSTVGVEEFSNNVEVTPFPNPANEMITIPFKTDVRGMAMLNIFSADGKLVSAQQININTNQIEVDVTSIANGNYTFNLQYEDHTESTFSVLVNR